MPDPDTTDRRPAARLAALLLAAALPLALAGCGEEAPQSNSGKPAASAGETVAVKAPAPLGHGFDFYVLSLSWSPTWCMDNDAAGRGEQCRSGRNAGFIVHGLWPQFERGFPEYCRSREPDRVPAGLGRQYLDIIPSLGLIGHQWRKHGSCSGLSQRDYLAATRAAFARIAIPDSLEEGSGERLATDAIEAALVATNPGLSERGIAVTCDGGRLDEIRICMTPGLDFRDCPEVDRTACKAKTITQPPVR
ncbi:ribonuclease T2 [Mycoplana sp. BE70]|uniref:ribonuclease T2 family protein n=1 Tax=Mycoplana sp. BE70 TaxID=2817775 RepID=UPI0028591D66|nr:ribonuclease T(2) [Mycoplana sp. BE70]MDR6757406.1 ribonuclease T2 [Mycoplana sp. BE70]